MKRNTPQCSNCWNSIFRNMRGKTVLYCGYYYRPVPNDGMACDNYTNANQKKQ